MNQMCTDHAADVADSPVRSATSLGINPRNKSNDVTEVNHSTSTPGHSGLQKFFHRGAKDQPIVIDSGCKAPCLLPPKWNGSSRKSLHLATPATLPLAGSSFSGNACPVRKGVTEKKPHVLFNDAVNVQCPQQSGRSLSVSQSSPLDCSFVDLTERNLRRHVNRKASTNEDLKNVKADFRKNIELPNLASSHDMPHFSNMLCNVNEADNMNQVGTSINSGEAGAIQNGSGSGGSLSVLPFSSPRVNRQRKLVRNGCISPNNIAKAKQLAGTDVNGSGNVANNGSGSTASSAPISIDIMELVAAGNDSHKRKGKEVVNHPFSSNGRDLINKNLDGRGSMSFKRKATETGNSNRQAGKSYEESGGWRPRNSWTAEMNPQTSFDTEQHVVGDTNGPWCSSQRHDNISHPRVQLQLNGTRSAAKARIKRQKQGSTSASCGESSTSVTNDSEAALISSSPELFNPKSAFTSSANLQRIIDVDNSSSQLRSRLHEEARARQVEADALLARELQEQLYREAPGFGIGEIDEHIALSLQQQDDLSHGFPRARRPVSNTRGSSLFNMNRQSLSTRSSNILRGSRAGSSALGRTRLRSRFPGQSRTLQAPRERTSLFPEGMNIDTRMDILGALEEINDMRMTTAILEAQRDFNENDYEMLLALDDNNNRNGGASPHQINGLPQSTVKSDNFGEACAICLDTPTVGDTIRHLPCLHKFHKDCIDPWLRRKTSCPVCKSSIT